MISASLVVVLATRVSASDVRETHTGLRLKRQDVIAQPAGGTDQLARNTCSAAW